MLAVSDSPNFMASSYGKFAPNFEVVGPYTLPKTLASYGANDDNGYETHTLRVSEITALQEAISRGWLA